jgi:hypothetical protein
MPRFAKDSVEAKEHAKKMRDARNEKRKEKGLPPLKEKNVSTEDIVKKSEKAIAKRHAEMSPEERKESEKNKARLKKAIEADKKKALPSSEAPATVKKVQKAAKKRAAEEGVKIAEPPAEKVKKMEDLTLAELKRKVRELRTVMCPAVGKMKKIAVQHEIHRLREAEGSYDAVEFAKDKSLKELRAELRDLRKKHCPPVSRMKKAALLVEAVALEASSKKVAAAAIPSLEERELRQKEAEEEMRPMLKEIAKTRRAARAREKRQEKKEAKQAEIAKKAAAEVKPEEAMSKEEAIKEFLKPKAKKESKKAKAAREEAERKAKEEEERKAKEEAERKAKEEEEAAKKKAEAALERKKVFQGKAMKGKKKSLIDLMTKDEILHVVKKSKCKMLEGVDLSSMTREEVIAKLQESCCPVLKELCEKTPTDDTTPELKIENFKILDTNKPFQRTLKHFNLLDDFMKYSMMYHKVKVGDKIRDKKTGATMDVVKVYHSKRGKIYPEFSMRQPKKETFKVTVGGEYVDRKNTIYKLVLTTSERQLGTDGRGTEFILDQLEIVPSV